jgi:hypothetical protein
MMSILVCRDFRPLPPVTLPPVFFKAVSIALIVCSAASAQTASPPAVPKLPPPNPPGHYGDGWWPQGIPRPSRTPPCPAMLLPTAVRVHSQCPNVT